MLGGGPWNQLTRTKLYTESERDIEIVHTLYKNEETASDGDESLS